MTWGKIKDGDTNALGNLYDEYIDELFAYGIRIAEDREHVKDCIHDLFLDLYKYRKNLGETDNIKFYLLKSLKRKINKKYQSKIVPLHSGHALKHAIESIPTASIESEMIDLENTNEKNVRLKQAISFLPKRQRQSLFLRFNEGRSYDEIADMMNVSIETSRTLIYRGVKELKKRLILPILIPLILSKAESAWLTICQSIEKLAL